MKHVGTLAAAIVFAAALPAASAAVVNGDFESPPDLTGWYSSSTTAMATGAAGYTQLQGAQSALIVAVSSAPLTSSNTCATDIWNTACPQPLPFVPSGAPLPTHGAPYVTSNFSQGAFIGQDVAVLAGDTLSWNWFFAGDSIDGARFYATDGNTPGTVIPYSATSFTFPTAGLWSIYFGLFQGSDPWYYSTVTVDSVALNGTPEPGTLALVLGASTFLCGFASKRRPRRA